MQAYRPPAYWNRIADIRAAVTIPVIANGEIWTVQDAAACRAASGSDMLMIGRGAVADPGLGLAIKSHMLGERSGQSDSQIAAVTWPTLMPLVLDFWHIVTTRLDSKAQAGRLKQWLNFLRRRFPEAEVAYQALKTVNSPAEVEAWLQQNLQSQAAQAQRAKEPSTLLAEQY